MPCREFGDVVHEKQVLVLKLTYLFYANEKSVYTVLSMMCDIHFCRLLGPSSASSDQLWLLFLTFCIHICNLM